MKILMYCLNYAPELTGIGKYTSEQAEWLVAQGHDVRVVTAPPYYPEWKISTGYSGWRFRSEELNGVKIFRAPLWVPRRPSGLKRLLHLASFAICSLPAIIWQAAWRPDIVFIVEPPLFCAPTALIFSKIIGAKSWLHIQDFEVDAAFALGLLKFAWLRKLVASGERLLVRQFDRVSTISHAMLDLAKRKGVEDQQLIFLPNWANLTKITPRENTTVFRKKFNISKEAIVCLYSGNMGGKQGLEILADVAEALHNDPLIHFIFCGDGPEKASLQRRCADLERVHFLPLQPAELLPDLLATADIHLLPQRADAADLVMPSKLTGMLASGRPIIATAHPGTELANAVTGRGLVVPPEDPAAIVDAISALAREKTHRSRLGAEARHFAERTLSIDNILNDFTLHARNLLLGRSHEAQQEYQ
ncbi:WcaI family glycosyltransferase [Cupriavidus necator]